MGPFRSLDELYWTVDALIVDLAGLGRMTDSKQLGALMKVAWTTGTELIYALGKELERAVGEPDHAQLPVDIRNRINQIITAVDGYLGSYKEELKRLDEDCDLKEAEEKRNEARIKAAISEDLKRRDLMSGD